MGKTTNSGLAHGTKGSPQQTLEQENLINKIRKSSHINNSKIKKLENTQVKFNKNDLVMVAENNEGKVNWLETGNESAGLKHILFYANNNKGHIFDFQNKLGVSPQKLPQYIGNVIEHGTPLEKKITTSNGNKKITITYHYRGGTIRIAFGNNGYIVTAFPL